MHHAPAVHYLVVPSRWVSRLMGALWLLGCGAMVVFFTTQVVTLPIGIAWGAAVLMGAALAWRTGRSTPCGDLHWDGVAWHWSGFSAPSTCRLVLQMDWQQCLLVTVQQPASRPIWLWLEPQNDRQAWLALRRAVVGAHRAATSHANDDGPVALQEQA